MSWEWWALIIWAWLMVCAMRPWFGDLVRAVIAERRELRGRR